MVLYKLNRYYTITSPVSIDRFIGETVMNIVIFWTISILTAVLSEVSHPPIEMWAPISAVVWAVTLVGAGFAAYMWKKSELAPSVALFTFFIFWEYLIVSIVGFIRMPDDIMSKPLEEKIMTGIGAILFIVVAHFLNKKLEIYTEDTETE